MTLFVFGISLLGMMAGVVLLILGLIKKKKLKGGIVLGVSILLFIVSFMMPAPEGSKEKVEVASKTEEELKQEKATSEAKKEEENKVKEEEERKVKEKELAEQKAKEEAKANEEANKKEEEQKVKADESKLKEEAESNGKAETPPPPTTVSTTDTSTILVNDIKKIVTDELGKKNNLKKNTIKDVQYVASDKGAIIALNANENLTTNMTKKGMWKDSKDILQPLSKVNGLDIIIIHWYFPLVDTYGNEKDGIVMSFEINKETLNKINWDNFLTDNIPNVVNNYFEHQAFNK